MNKTYLAKHLLFFLFLFFTLSTSAQRFGYIDTNLILSKMPEYQQAQKELEKLSKEWEENLNEKQKILDSMWQVYKINEPLMTEKIKKREREKIKKREDGLREYQLQTFGYQGILYSRRMELIKPLQEKIFRAAEKIAKRKKLQFLFDKSTDMIMIYTDVRHNYTDYILEELGLGDPDDVPR